MLKGVLPHFRQGILAGRRNHYAQSGSARCVTTSDAKAYRERIMAALPEGMSFNPLMVLYLTEDTDPSDVEAGFKIRPRYLAETLSGRCDHQFAIRASRDFDKGAGCARERWPRLVSHFVCMVK